MHVERQSRIKDLLSDALELEPAMRDSFLDRAAGGDPAIRIEVRALIDAHERADAFLVDPTINHPPTSTAAGQMIGRYHLLNLIGEGGFGSVYLAQQQEPVVREVALKVIKLGMDTRQVIARFEAERQALAMMDHPNIASVYDAGATETGRPYFVMELVKGVPLTEYCDRHQLPLTKRIRLFQDVCAAVQHAHIKGVIHRDLKPSNVLVSNGTAEAARPKIIDFGIAKAISGKLTDHTLTTELSRLVGTPEYMSPEQASASGHGGADIDTRADIYSLGVLLYELLTGATPFDRARLRSSTFEELQHIIRNEEPPKPSTRLSTVGSLPGVAANRALEPNRLMSQLRGDLDWIALKALEKDRERRYASAAELADDLQRHLDHQPVRAGPPSAWYRTRKFIRRHRVSAVATALVALAVIGGIIGTTVGMVQARDAANQAQAVNDFMREVLTSVKSEADGADVRLVDVLDKASASTSQRFGAHPLLEAQVRDLLGAVYFDLSLSSHAKVEFKRAMELWGRYAGADDPRTLLSEHLYVVNAINIEHIAEVESRLPDLARRTLRAFGPNDATTLEVQRAIGRMHIYRGRIDEAEAILQDVRARVTAHGDDDRLQIRLLRNLISIGRIRSTGASGEARAMILASLEPLARERIERADRAYGPQSLVVQDAQVTWAAILIDRREYQAAAELARAVLDASLRQLGACHFVRMLALDVLAVALHRLGDSTTSAELMLSQIECTRTRDEPILLIAEISDALPILDRGGRWVEGEALSREFIERLHAMGGGHGDMQFLAELWAVRFISLQGRLDEAHEQFRSLLNRAQRADLGMYSLSRLHLFYGSNLCRKGLFEESETEIQAAADLLADFRQGTNKMNPDDVLVEFIALYEAWGKHDLAQEYRTRRDEMIASILRSEF